MVVENQSPFIYLFRGIGKNFFYDVNRNEILSIKEDTYNILMKCVKSNQEIEGKDYNNEIIDLISNGYLLANRVSEITHSSTNLLKPLLDRTLNNLILQVTQSCNLCCEYCTFTQSNHLFRNHSIKAMSWDVAKSSIDYLRDNSIDSPDVNLAFYGGEPLLNIRLIKKSVEYFNKVFIGKNRTFSMTTNGTLLLPNISKFLIENKFRLTISLDGNMDINDRKRKFSKINKSVFSEVIKNIEWIINYSQDYQKYLSINMVLDPSVPFDDYLSVFADYPILKNVIVKYSIIEDSNLDKRNSFCDEFIFQHNYNAFLMHLENLGRFRNICDNPMLESMRKSNLIMMNEMRIESSLNSKCAPSGPCLPGVHRFMVTTEGNFFPCEKVNELNPACMIGTNKLGIDLEKSTRVLNYSHSLKKRCENCFAFRECTNCIRIYNGNSTLFEESLSACENVKRSFSTKLMGFAIINELRSGSFFQRNLR